MSNDFLLPWSYFQCSEIVIRLFNSLFVFIFSFSPFGHLRHIKIKKIEEKPYNKDPIAPK